MQGSHKEGEVWQLEIWTWKSYVRLTILHNSKWAETVRGFLWNISGILEQISTRGGPLGGQIPPRRTREPRRALMGCAHPGPPLVPIFWYIGHFDLEKIKRGLSGWSAAATRRNLGRSTFALRQSDSAGGTSLPEGQIIVIIITNNSPILGRAISINIFNSTISSQALVHLLCSILLPEL